MSIIYQYQMVLSLANRDIKISKIEEEIDKSFKEFNIRSSSAKNIKEIVKCEIREDENLLYIWLNSNNKMNSPLRGLFLFSKLIMEELDNNEEKKSLPKDIIRNKCFFKLVEEPKEFKKLKLEKVEGIKQVQEDVSINDDGCSNKSEEVKENIALAYLKQLCKAEINILMDFLISSEISEDDRKKIFSIEKILKGVK